MQNVKMKTGFALMFATMLACMCVLGLSERAWASDPQAQIMSSDDPSVAVLEVSPEVQAYVHSSDKTISYGEANPELRCKVKNVATHNGQAVPVSLTKVVITDDYNTEGDKTTKTAVPDMTITINDTVVAQWINGEYKQGDEYIIQAGETVYPTIHIDAWSDLPFKDNSNRTTQEWTDLAKEFYEFFSIHYFANAVVSDTAVDRIWGPDAINTNWHSFKMFCNRAAAGEVSSIKELIIDAGLVNVDSYAYNSSSQMNVFGAISAASCSDYQSFICLAGILRNGYDDYDSSTNTINWQDGSSGTNNYMQMIKDLSSSLERVIIVGGTLEQQEEIYKNVNNYRNSSENKKDFTLYYNNDFGTHSDISGTNIGNYGSDRCLAQWEKTKKDNEISDADLASKTAIVVYGNNFSGYSTADSTAQGDEEGEEAAAVCVGSYAITHKCPVFMVDPNSSSSVSAAFDELAKFNKVVFVGNCKNANGASNSMLTLANKFKSSSQYKNTSKKPIIDTVSGAGSVDPTLTSKAGDDQTSLSVAFAMWAINQKTEPLQSVNYLSGTNNSTSNFYDTLSGLSYMSAKNGIMLGGFSDQGQSLTEYSVSIDITTTESGGYSLKQTTTAANLIYAYAPNIRHGYVFGGTAAVPQEAYSLYNAAILKANTTDYEVKTATISDFSAGGKQQTYNDVYGYFINSGNAFDVMWGNNAFIGTWGWNNNTLPETIECKTTSGAAVKCNVSWDFSSIETYQEKQDDVVVTKVKAWKDDPYGFCGQKWVVKGTVSAPTSNITLPSSKSTIYAALYVPYVSK